MGLLFQVLFYLAHRLLLTTSAHSTGSYTVTVNNVTDPAGNIINPLYKTANYLSAIDNVRPYFTGLTVTSSTSLTVNFSEKLDPVKAKNKNNYSINKNDRNLFSPIITRLNEYKIKYFLSFKV